MVRKLKWKNLYEIKDELMEYKQDFILAYYIYGNLKSLIDLFGSLNKLDFIKMIMKNYSEDANNLGQISIKNITSYLTPGQALKDISPSLLTLIVSITYKRRSIYS